MAAAQQRQRVERALVVARELGRGAGHRAAAGAHGVGAEGRVGRGPLGLLGLGAIPEGQVCIDLIKAKNLENADRNGKGLKLTLCWADKLMAFLPIISRDDDLAFTLA